MKIVETVDVFANGPFPASAEWAKVSADVEQAVRATDWPHGSGTFTIYPESGKKRDQGNGVVPIKIPCVAALKASGWSSEKLPPEKRKTFKTGKLDALIETSAGWVAFEWETGNISSSHRALNKLIQALARGELVGGFLVVPSDALAAYLTDRIGNIRELRPYIEGWGGCRLAVATVAVDQRAEWRAAARYPCVGCTEQAAY